MWGQGSCTLAKLSLRSHQWSPIGREEAHVHQHKHRPWFPILPAYTIFFIFFFPRQDSFLWLLEVPTVSQGVTGKRHPDIPQEQSPCPQEKGRSCCLLEKPLLQHWFVQVNVKFVFCLSFPICRVHVLTWQKDSVKPTQHLADKRL